MDLVDLDDRDFHICVDIEKGTQLGPVATTSIDDGRTVFAAYVTGHGRGQGLLKRTDDGGRTWSERLPVPDDWSTLLQVPTIFAMPGQDGGPRLLLFTGHYPIRLTVSDDLAET